MEWYKLLKNIFMVGGICSIIITLISFALLLVCLRSNKDVDKPVKETPLLKYSRVLVAGIILTVLFSVAFQLLVIFQEYKNFR